MDGLDVVQLNIIWQLWHHAHVVRLALFHHFIGDGLQCALDAVDQLMQFTDRTGMFADLDAFLVQDMLQCTDGSSRARRWLRYEGLTRIRMH